MCFHSTFQVTEGVNHFDLIKNIPVNYDMNASVHLMHYNDWMGKCIDGHKLSENKLRKKAHLVKQLLFQLMLICKRLTLEGFSKSTFLDITVAQF